MSKYINLFETYAQYQAAESGLTLPNITYCEDELDMVFFNKTPNPITIVYKGDGASATNIITKNINAFGDVYTLDESSITKITLDDNEVTLTDFTLADYGQYGGTCNVYTYTFNDENNHTLKIFTSTSEMFRFSPWGNGPDASQSSYFSSIKSVIIPNGITSISDYTFKRCKGLTSCTIGSGVTSIGGNAFNGCTSLTSIEIPSGVTSIGQSAFGNCTGLTSIDIPNSVTSIGEAAFDYCTSLTSCTIGSGVTSIGGSAFRFCSGLTSVTLPNGVTSIGNMTFSNCTNLTSIDIPDSVTSISTYAFYQCYSLTSCTIGSGVTSIGASGFTQCSGLTSIVIPDSVTSIGNSAFAYCRGLTSCTIGSGVTSIGGMAFFNCGDLTSVTVEATTPPTLETGVFANTNDCPIYVPSASVDTYKAATNWSSYASRIQAIP